MKQEVNFKVDLENRKDLSSNVTYSKDIIEFILNNYVSLVTRTIDDKIGHIGNLEDIELVYVCDSVIRFKCILCTPVTINLDDLDIRLYFMHTCSDSETEITTNRLIGVAAYFVNRKIENILTNLTDYKLVKKSNNVEVLSGEVRFEHINDYVIIDSIE